jgi:hypothetical protein
MRAIVILAASLALAGCAASGPVAPGNLTVVQIRQVCDAFESMDEQRTIDQPSAMVVRYGRERGICPPGDRELVYLAPGVYVSVTRDEAQLACDISPKLGGSSFPTYPGLREMIEALASESAKQGLCGASRPVAAAAARAACMRVSSGGKVAFEDGLLAAAAVADGLCGGSEEYGALDHRTGLFGTARMAGGQECFAPSVPEGIKRELEERAARGEALSRAEQGILAGEVCGPPKLPSDELVLATCARVERAHAEGRTVDDDSERLAQQGRTAGVCG